MNLGTLASNDWMRTAQWRPPTGGITGGGTGSREQITMPAGDMNTAGANADPFGYTNGSFLTPWSRTFTPPAGAAPSAGGGGAPAAMPAAPGFGMEFGGFAARDVGDFNLGSAFQAPGQPFSGGRLAAPAAFLGSRVNAGPGFQAPVGVFTPGAVNVQNFGPNTPGFSADRFEGPGAFQAPDVTKDPGYQFRLKQGEDALLNQAGARGLLRNGNTLRALMDYNQGAASQEYGAAYGRAKDEYDTAANLALAGYDRNYAAARDENSMAYGRELDAYDRNRANTFDAYDRNTAAGYRSNETAYGRGADEYDRSRRDQIAVDEINYGRGAQESDRTFSRNMAVDDANYARGASEYDRNFSNARDVYQMNTGNRLAAHQANAQNAQAMGNLGWQVASGTYDRNFNNYQTAFGIDESRRQQAAAMAAAGAGAGRAEDALNYNRALQQYQMDYSMFNENQDRQFNRLYALANMGQGAASQAGAYAGNYGNAAGQYITGMGNAIAAGQVGAGNAWAQGMSGAGSAAMQGAGMYLGGNDRYGNGLLYGRNNQPGAP